MVSPPLDGDSPLIESDSSESDEGFFQNVRRLFRAHIVGPLLDEDSPHQLAEGRRKRAAVIVSESSESDEEGETRSPTPKKSAKKLELGEPEEEEGSTPSRKKDGAPSNAKKVTNGNANGLSDDNPIVNKERAGMESEEAFSNGTQEGVFPTGGSKAKPLSTENSTPQQAGAQPTSAVRGDRPAPPTFQTPALPPKPAREKCLVTFAYDAQNEDELQLKEGDVVVVLEKDIEDIGWWRGELRGKVGVFPNNFVELLPSEDLPDTATGPSVSKDTKRASRVAEATGVKLPGLDGVHVNKKPHPPLSTPVISSGSQPKQSKRAANSQPLVSTGNHVSRNSGLMAGSSTVSAESSSNSQSGLSETDFDAIRLSGPPLSHPNASRGKGPKRRPPSTLLNLPGRTSPVDDKPIVNGERAGMESEEAFSNGTQDLSMSDVKAGSQSPPASGKDQKKPAWLSELRNSRLFQDAEKPPLVEKPAVPNKKPTGSPAPPPPTKPTSVAKAVPPATRTSPSQPKKDIPSAGTRGLKPPAPPSGGGDETTTTSDDSDEVFELKMEVKHLRREMDEMVKKFAALRAEFEKEKQLRIKMEAQVNKLLKT